MAVCEHPLGDRLLAEVDDAVVYARGRRWGRLDIERAAARLNVELRREDLGEQLLGLTLDDSTVLLHDRLVGAERSFVFAHELAHVLRRRGRFASLGDRAEAEEWFADWFARELVLPRSMVWGRWSDARLAALHVNHEILALQRAALGETPRLMRSGKRVLCRECGTVNYRCDCECAAWRYEDAQARSKLPDARRLMSTERPPAGVDLQLRIGGVVILVECKRSSAPGSAGGGALLDQFKRYAGKAGWSWRSAGLVPA